MPELVPAVPGSPDWLAARPALKMSPYSRTGMIHGAYAAAYPAAHPIATAAYRHPALAWSAMYRRGFARGALAGRAARHA